MISIAPHTEAHRALRYIVAQPGQLDAEAVGQLLKRPRIEGPADVLAARRAMLAHGFAPVRTAKRQRPFPPIEQEGPTWSALAARLFHGLQKRGLIENCRPPMVAEEWADLAADDPAEAVALAAHDGATPDPTGLRVALLRRLVQRAPATVGEWVGKGPSGNVQRAVADLVAWSLVVPGSYRWPTPAGVAVVEDLAAANGRCRVAFNTEVMS